MRYCSRPETAGDIDISVFQELPSQYEKVVGKIIVGDSRIIEMPVIKKGEKLLVLQDQALI